MKTIFTSKVTKVITVFIIIIFQLIDVCQSQYYWIKKVDANNPTNITNSQLFQYQPAYTSFNNLGLRFNGNTYPVTAAFQIKDSLYQDRALFQVDGVNVGSIKLWNNDGSTKYGIWQSSQTGISVLNYFQDPVKFGNMTISGTRANYTSFITGYGNGLINFIMGPTVAGDTIIPLSIRRNGIRVRTNIITDSFQLLTNPGLGKVLVSDADGNANWTDGSNFSDNKWLYNKDSDIYANPLRKHVGIGFQSSNEKIYQMLHVVDGNILISRSPTVTKAPSSKNGSVLFSDYVSDTNQLGEWGIEYETNDTVYAANGLNFWKPYSSGHPGNNYLFLRNDGNFGIGTNNTFGYKLGVAGSIICTELKVRKFADWPDYVLKDDYKLKPLNELAEYINEHQRLPEMPSAKEVSEHGVNVGEMDVTLVKKIEELTKYLLDQQKQLLDQQSLLLDQQKQINDLKQKIESGNTTK